MRNKITGTGFILLMTLLLFGCSDDAQQSPAAGESAVPEALKHILLDQPSSLPPKAAKKEEQSRPLKIGVLGPETGPGSGSDYGLSVLAGAKLAAKYINDHGGIDGKEVELLHFDDKEDLQLTQQGVKEFIAQDVIAILAAPTGWSTFAPTRQVNQAHTLLFSIGSRRRIGRSGPYVLRAALPTELATEALIKYAVEEFGFKNYALVSSSLYDYSLDLSASFKMALLNNGAVIQVDADTYDTYTGQKDYRKIIEAINSSTDIQAVVFTGEVAEAIIIAKGLAEKGLSLPILGGEDLFTPEFLAAEKSVQGSLVYSAFAPDNKSSQAVEFMQAHGNGTPDRFEALAYDSFLFLTEAIKAAGNTKPTEIREALFTLKSFEGATGAMSFSPEDGIVKAPFIHRVESGSKGMEFVLVSPQ
ncbi:hypothetical protein MNBD_GAMMA26-863 [hydrothermal vent metagenome]|uniref:Leucine-binding protein domain-containing protein n=1 Tax=hydrothermal vent metagenome TaxID=652676 RepID=A0A3B1BXZ3_9ZZZZ